MSTTDASPSTSSSDPNSSSYSKRHSRITKENLFMILALWMQDFPVSREPTQVEGDEVPEASRRKDGKNPKTTKPESGKDPKPPCKKVGAVLVSPNDIVYAVDCTRDGVHGIARLLIKHHDIPEGCKVFVSRKPCSFCTKLLVQSGKVKRVFYLPFEPEYCDSRTLNALIESPKTLSEEEKAENKKIVEAFVAETVRVDTLFKASAIGQSVFVPTVEEAVRAKKKKVLEDGAKSEKNGYEKKTLYSKYYKETWMKIARERLPWPTFDDNMAKEVSKDFQDTMEWVAQILVLPEEVNTFKKFGSDTVALADNSSLRKQAVRLLEMAQFLAERSDDPKTDVGAIITDKQMEIKALGWNGFPLKALYGEFPRASKHDQTKADKKYPFVIHAEQNALLMRNDKNLKGGTLFVTKAPCDECAPLIKMQGIETVFVNEKSNPIEAQAKHLGYLKFPEMVTDGDFDCFERETATTSWWSRTRSCKGRTRR